MSRGFREPGGRPAFRQGAEGLFSAHQVRRLVKAEFDRARRHGHPLAVVMGRVDRLDILADIHGTETRVAIQSALASIVARESRSYDLMAREPEDRFLLVLPQTDREGAQVVAERIRRRVAQLSLEVGGRRIAVTASLGVAAHDGRESLFCDAVLAQAESALARARGLGGDRVELAPPGGPGGQGPDQG